MKDEVLKGTLTRVRYEKDGFAIVEVVEPDKVKPVAVVGEIVMPKVGMDYTFRGRWENSPKWGDQFRASEYTADLPTSQHAIMRYLCDHAAGIGSKIATKIVNLYKEEAIEVLKRDPERVSREISGLGLGAAKRIADQLLALEQTQVAEVQLTELLDGIGVNKRQRGGILAAWGGSAVDRIKANPYELTRLHGIGWTTADKVAMHVGFPRKHPNRIASGIVHFLREAARQEGSTCMERESLLEVAAGLLGVGTHDVDAVLEDIAGERVIVTEHGKFEYIYDAPLYAAEQGVCRELARLASWDGPLSEPQAVEGLEQATKKQVNALRRAAKSPVSIVTGGPGTGKTTNIKWMCQAFPDRLEIAAPTGKAAKRIQEVVGQNARTIHSLLHPMRVGDGWSFLKNRHNKLEAKSLIVDETSMVDVALLHSLLQSVSDGCRVIFVGDADQLPSVQPGNCFRDMIESGVIPVTRLSKVHRQEAGDIVTACALINRGKAPVIRNAKAKDLFAFRTLDTDRAVRMVVDLVKKKVPDKFGFEPPDEVQVLSPVNKKTCLSVDALNKELQDALNAHGQDIDGTPFRVGDKVVQKKNAHDLGIVNGDVGKIVEHDPGRRSLIVVFDQERTVAIPIKSHSLKLAYCMTVHSAQGSEWPCVVIPLHSCLPHVTLNRSWIYTAISRASKVCIVVGEDDLIEDIAMRDSSRRRVTMLSKMLESTFREEAP